MNPCPCGYLGAGDDRCTCDEGAVRSYAGRVSGPLLDRIDLHVRVPAVRWRELRGRSRPESTAEVRDRVREARLRAEHRLRGTRGGKDTTPGPCNALLTPAEIRRFCAPDAAGEALLRKAMEGGRLSARGYHRVLRVARTLADLEGRARLSDRHLALALGWRVGPRTPPPSDVRRTGRSVRRASGTVRRVSNASPRASDPARPATDTPDPGPS